MFVVLISFLRNMPDLNHSWTPKREDCPIFELNIDLQGFFSPPLWTLQTTNLNDLCCLLFFSKSNHPWNEKAFLCFALHFHGNRWTQARKCSMMRTILWFRYFFGWFANVYTLVTMLLLLCVLICVCHFILSSTFKMLFYECHKKRDGNVQHMKMVLLCFYEWTLMEISRLITRSLSAAYKSVLLTWEIRGSVLKLPAFFTMVRLS